MSVSTPLQRPLMALLVTASAALSGILAFAIPTEAAFPGPNGKIAFYTSRDGNAEIYTMNADGTGQTNVTNNLASDQDPAWSMDGTKIAFTSNRNGNSEIYTMNADGSGQTRLTSNAAGDVDPTWSPDGTKIAFATNRDGNSEIYTMNADGSGQTNVTDHAAFDGTAAWSPDGTKIAFATDRDGNVEVYVMNSGGTPLTRLTNNAAIDQLPNWSPNGAQITFESTRDGNSEIYVMNPNGTGQTRLTNNATTDVGPAWSPDGTKIAWQAGSGSAEIHTMNTDGTGQTNVTNDPAADQYPDWQAVDVVAPETAIDAGPVGSTGDSTPTLAFSSSEPGSTFECRVDAGAFVPCGSPHTTNELTNGAHNVEVRATDLAGNTDQTPALLSFSVDVQPATPPAPDGPQPSPTPRPALSKLNLRPSKFGAARSGASVARTTRRTPIGTIVSYMLSTRATVTFKAERATKGRMRAGKCRKPGTEGTGRRCTRYVTVPGTFKVSGTAGRNRSKFMGRIAGRTLPRGRYRLVARPKAAGKTGTAVRTSFRISK